MRQRSSLVRFEGRRSLRPRDHCQRNVVRVVVHLVVFTRIDAGSFHRRKLPVHHTSSHNREAVSDGGDEAVDVLDRERPAERDSVRDGQIAKRSGGGTSDIDVQRPTGILSESAGEREFPRRGAGIARRDRRG